MSKGWTEERRKKQAERIRQNKPWLKSTGPKTAAGKKKSSLNALKHGGRSRIWQDYISRILRLSDIYIEQALVISAFEREHFALTNELKKQFKKNKEIVTPPPVTKPTK